jgi:hypothetical protein
MSTPSPRQSPAHVDIPLDMPLRLEAAAIAEFGADGGMGARGLRREAARGRLVIYRVAGKDYTTRQDIKDMLQQCRAADRGRDSTCANLDATAADASAMAPSGSSSTGDTSAAQAAARTIVQQLRESSRTTSRKSTSRALQKASVLPFKSRSRTS